MKKNLLSVLVIVCMLLALAACGEGSGDVPDTTPAATVQAGPDANGNYVINGSFEEADFTGWTIHKEENTTDELDIYTRTTDCYDGVQSLHFYSGATNVDFTAEQTITGLEAGSYKLTAYVQGDAAGDANAEVYFYVIINGETHRVDGALNGYVNWYTAELGGLQAEGDITIGIRVKTAPGGWGTIDHITLVRE